MKSLAELIEKHYLINVSNNFKSLKNESKKLIWEILVKNICKNLNIYVFFLIKIFNFRIIKKNLAGFKNSFQGLRNQHVLSDDWKEKIRNYKRFVEWTKINYYDAKKTNKMYLIKLRVWWLDHFNFTTVRAPFRDDLNLLLLY